jgi:hypothetical protein
VELEFEPELELAFVPVLEELEPQALTPRTTATATTAAPPPRRDREESEFSTAGFSDLVLSTTRRLGQPQLSGRAEPADRKLGLPGGILS